MRRCTIRWYELCSQMLSVKHSPRFLMNGFRSRFSRRHLCVKGSSGSLWLLTLLWRRRVRVTLGGENILHKTCVLRPNSALLYAERTSNAPLSLLHCILNAKSFSFELSPPFLMTPDKYPVFLWCVSCSPQHKGETAWHRTQCVWWMGSHTTALTPFALYFMKWTSGSEINRPPWWMRTTQLSPYQDPAANLWQAKPAPSLDTPLVFEIKVDACNPGKWSLYSRLTPV